MVNSINVYTPWEQLCTEFKDIVKKPGAPMDRPIKHRIYLLYKAKQLLKLRLYRMGDEELAETKC